MRKIMLMACAAFALCAAWGGIDTGLLDSLLRVKSVSRDKENLRKAVDVLADDAMFGPRHLPSCLALCTNRIFLV